MGMWSNWTAEALRCCKRVMPAKCKNLHEKRKRNDIKNVPTMSAHIAQGTSCTRVLKMKKNKKQKKKKITHSVYKSLSRSVGRSAETAYLPALKVAGCKNEMGKQS